MRSFVHRGLYRAFQYVRGIKKTGYIEPINNYEAIMDRYRSYCLKNRDAVYRFGFTGERMEGAYKYVGGIEHGYSIYCTPNDSRYLYRRGEAPSYTDTFSEGKYKWTGECVYNEEVYFFPRTESDMLYVNKAYRIGRIKGASYNREHHYGGVLIGSEVVQPPRSTTHLLVWNLESRDYRRIEVCPRFLETCCRYQCSIRHPNGNAYFLPESGRVIKLNIATKEWTFIGKHTDVMVFDAKVGMDGNIYGFSIKGGGILKIDVTNESVNAIYPDCYFGAYGTKMGINGVLYSTPGTGRFVWAYDLRSETLKKVFDLEDNSYAKYAGGCTRRNGDIIGIPSFADRFIVGKTEEESVIPEELYRLFWEDCY